MPVSQSAGEVAELHKRPDGWVERMPSEWLTRRSLAFQIASAKLEKRRSKARKAGGKDA